MNLTWNEFKRKVDDAISSSGNNGTIKIKFIDVIPSKDDAVWAEILNDGLQIISHMDTDIGKG